MIFKEFESFLEKKTLTYNEINDLLITMLNLRQTWNYQSLKKATNRTWMTFKDKLSEEKKLILRNSIISLRKHFIEKLNTENYYWATTITAMSVYATLVSPFIINANKRKSVLASSL